VQIKVQILNPDSFLRPDMNSTVKFLPNEAKQTASSGPSGVLVPSTAVRERDGKKYVFIVYNGKALARNVTVRSTRSNGYLVDGLTGGEDVVVTGPANLKDGDKIKVKG